LREAPELLGEMSLLFLIRNSKEKGGGRVRSSWKDLYRELREACGRINVHPSWSL